MRSASAQRPRPAGRVSEAAIRSAYEFNNVIFTAARLPQIIQNFQAGPRCALPAAVSQGAADMPAWRAQAKSTGQLSAANFCLNFAGCLVRIFTSWKEGGGASMVRGYVLGAHAACWALAPSRARAHGVTLLRRRERPERHHHEPDLLLRQRAGQAESRGCQEGVLTAGPAVRRGDVPSSKLPDQLSRSTACSSRACCTADCGGRACTCSARRNALIAGPGQPCAGGLAGGAGRAAPRSRRAAALAEQGELPFCLIAVLALDNPEGDDRSASPHAQSRLSLRCPGGSGTRSD